MLDLSIIIVSWNVAGYLEACLESILASDVAINVAGTARLGTEIIVVDSNSHDDTVAMLRTRFPMVNVLPQDENVGFTRGNNIGLRAARGRFMLLLNPDTEVEPTALKTLGAFLDAHPDVGIVGPYTRNTDGTYQSSRRRFPTLATAFFESTWLEPYAPKALLRRYYVDDLPPTETAEVDWVQGSALMIRREVYEEIGGLDERYVMFSEELDWCRRARAAGWRVFFAADAQITHHGGKSSQQVSARKHIHFQESKLRYFHKYHGALAASTLRIFLLASYAWQIVLEAAKHALGSKPALRRERIHIYREVLRSGLKVS